jgi:site-specific DNA-adenine methylase
MKPPVFYFGGKRKIAPELWKRFGKPNVYIEPFVGMAATLLARPVDAFPKTYRETVNDRDALVANFFRSSKLAPELVLEHASDPPMEIELRARWTHINKNRGGLRHRLLDLEFCDPQTAGWFLYCYANFIRPAAASAEPKALKPSTRASGVLSPNARDGARGYFAALKERLANVRICCGDYMGILTDAEVRVSGRQSVCALIDPPYRKNAKMYADGADAFDYDALIKRCNELGEMENVRVALCGYSDDYDMPDDWRIEEWAETQGGVETIWFSPGCKNPKVSDFWVENHLDIDGGVEMWDGQQPLDALEGLFSIIRRDEETM